MGSGCLKTIKREDQRIEVPVLRNRKKIRTNSTKDFKTTDWKILSRSIVSGKLKKNGIVLRMPLL